MEYHKLRIVIIILSCSFITWITDKLVESWREESSDFWFEFVIFFLCEIFHESGAIISTPIGEIEETLESTFEADVFRQHHFHVLQKSAKCWGAIHKFRKGSIQVHEPCLGAHISNSTE
jgi:hypothetical protein